MALVSKLCTTRGICMHCAYCIFWNANCLIWSKLLSYLSKLDGVSMMGGSGCLAVMGYRWRKGPVVWLWWDINDRRVRLFGCDGISMTERSGCLTVMGYRWRKGQVVWLWWDINDRRVRLFGCGNTSAMSGSASSEGKLSSRLILHGKARVEDLFWST